jgi:3-oxoacyl-[acyl-carrier-protein] synthase II
MAIRGIGLVGGFGCGGEAALKALGEGGSPNSTVLLNTPGGSVSYPVYIADSAPLKKWVSSGLLRRTNQYSRLATLGACLALEDAGIAIPCNSGNIAVVVASGYGASSTTFAFLESVIKEGDSFASPTQFSNSVHSAAASNITILLQITGPCITVTQFEMSATAALLNAWTMLAEGVVDTVLVGGVDEINDILVYCYSKFWPGQVPDRIRPFDYDAQTAIMGEGAAFMVLTRDDGPAAKYGCIDDVLWTRADDCLLKDNLTVVAGLDGHQLCGKRYQKLLGRLGHDKVRSFCPVYGSLPAGQMFDLALGAMASKAGLMPGPFCSVKMSASGELGIVHCL